VPEGQCELVSKALEEQAQIGSWHLAVHGYLSWHWGAAIMAHPVTSQSKDQGKSWTRKMILLLLVEFCQWDVGKSKCYFTQTWAGSLKEDTRCWY
jgi:hypothetical protein